MIINHNIPALNTYNALTANNRAMSNSLAKLSSGLRINKAADDAAGLAISEKMRAQIRGLDQAQRNAQDSISLIQTAEGALNETLSILQRMRELSVQAANDTYTSEDRQNIQLEIDQLIQEVDRIAATTQFNGKNLLDGSSSALVSSDKAATKVYMRDGLRIMDEYGQKLAASGNYRIDLVADAGSAQVLKSAQMKIKHDVGVASQLDIDLSSGVTDVAVTGGLRYNTAVQIATTVGAASGMGSPARGISTGTGGVGGNFTFEGVAVAGALLNGKEYYINIIEGQGPNAGLEAAFDGETNTLTITLATDAVGAVSAVSDSVVNAALARIAPFGLTPHLDFGISLGSAGNGAGRGSVIMGDVGTGGIVGVTGFAGGFNEAYSPQEVQTYMTGATRPVDEARSTGRPIFFAQNAAPGSGLYYQRFLASKDTTGPYGYGTPDATSSYNVSLEFEVRAVDVPTDTLTVDVRAAFTNQAGQVVYLERENHEMDMAIAGVSASAISYVSFTTDELQTAAMEQLGLTREQVETAFGERFYLYAAYNGVGINSETDYMVGDKAVVHVRGRGAALGTVGAKAELVTVMAVDAYGNMDTRQYTFADGVMNNGTVSFGVLSIETLESSTFLGNSYNGTISLSADKLRSSTPVAASFYYEEGKGKIASLDTRLYDLQNFWDASGNFILENPKDVTIVAGEGKTAKITLTKADTVRDVRMKLNAAIADQLGQALITGVDDSDELVSYVTHADPKGLEAVEGTYVIRSVVTGDYGELTFIGDDSILGALGLSVLQEAKNTSYLAMVTDAHTTDIIAENVKVSENRLNGVVHANVDVEFDANTGLAVKWDAKNKTFKIYGGEARREETFIHLADNTLVFHVGANQRQDVGSGIANMTSAALGVNNLLVTSNDLANRSIGKLDIAITRVSGERAKLGALQNRLDHTVNNLTVASENLTSAESRIRDVDMAKEMMNFTKYSILARAATSMLAQANAMPQNVLTLLR